MHKKVPDTLFFSKNYASVVTFASLIDNAPNESSGLLRYDFTKRPAFDRLQSFLSKPKLLFLSSATYTGNLGGLAGADAKCQSLANATPALGGKTFKAWLSNSVISARDRLTHATVPYKLVGGATVANNWSDLVDGTLAVTPNIDEGRHSIGTVEQTGAGTFVWTNSYANGAIQTTNLPDTCQNWTTTASPFGVGGFFTLTTSRWSHSAALECAKSARLYCMEQ